MPDPNRNTFPEDAYHKTSRDHATADADKVISERVRATYPGSCELYGEDGFWVADLSIVRNQLDRWKRNLPLVRPFYAVKCNPDPRLLALLASPEYSMGFDCATHKEISSVLSLLVPPENIIYANPCKAASHIRYAATVSVKKMTFDNATELYKIKTFFPTAECVIRIKTEADGDGNARYQLSKKYGVSVNGSRELLSLAQRLGLNVVGVAFHVGSAQEDTDSYVKSIALARQVFDIAEDIGYKFSLLDIGGGFMHDNFEEAAEKVNYALRCDFMDLITRGDVDVIAEPGRYFCATAFSLVSSVLAVREEFEDLANSAITGKRMIYMSDGMYGNINAAIWPGELTFPEVVKGRRLKLDGRRVSAVSCGSSDSGLELDDSDPEMMEVNLAGDGDVGQRIEGELIEYAIWGPTCDCEDVILKSAFLPGGIEMGDWLVFRGLGAYSTCMRTQFNGFAIEHKIFYVNDPNSTFAISG